MKGSVPVVLHGVSRTVRRLVTLVTDKPHETNLWRTAALAAAGMLLCTWMSVPVDWRSLLAVASFSVLFSTGLYNYLYVAARTSPRDLRGLMMLLKVKYQSHRMYVNNWTVPNIFQKLVQDHPSKYCFIMEETKWTYAEVDAYSNQVANVFWEAGFRRGDVVVLFMESRPEYPAIWMGLAKIGVITALVNFNLRHQPLVHSIDSANAKAIIFGSELVEAINEVRPSVKDDVTYYRCGKEESKIESPARNLDELIVASSKANPPKVNANSTDSLVYIYTSGTTGLPKAAVITHLRYFFLAKGGAASSKVRTHDVIYDPLPLYHTAGGALGIGLAFLNGNTVVIRRKFSASQFWRDCIKYNCTVAQYIGEICRYVLAQPPTPEDRSHSVWMMFGNGLRPQIWEAFTKRFNIKRIVEFYGATEGNANIVNNENRPGAVGYLSRIAPFFYPCTLIKVNEETGEPVRDKRGMCIKCKPGDPGEFVGKIICDNPERAFDGYVNKAATKKKIVNNVFSKGDIGFLSGDILVMDNFGFLYFKDRTGDTFRWKGENVSTAEVEAVISNVLGLQDCVVYGVDVHGLEGKAGMAAILDPHHQIDFNELALSLQKILPPYARPVFIRTMDSLPMTGTFKLKKVELQAEGYNPAVCGAKKIFYLNGGKYCELNEKNYQDICSGQVKL